MSFQTKREIQFHRKVERAKAQLKNKCKRRIKVFSCVKSQYNPERKVQKKLRQFKENHSIVRYIIQEVQANKSVR